MSYVSDTYGNKGALYSYKSENTTYKKLDELYKENGPDHVYVVHAFYLNTKADIPHPVAIVDDNIGADLPSYLMETVKGYRADATLTDLINKGLVGFTIYTYESKNTKKYKKPCGYSIDLVDIDKPEQLPDTDEDLPFPV